MATTTSTQILIVGAGPVGLVLALMLAKNGVAVRIIEKSSTPRIGQRGAGVMPRTLELYSIADILPAILEAGAKALPLSRVYETGATEPLKTTPLYTPPEASPSAPLTAPVLLSQARHEAILREALGRFGVEVEMGVELVGLEQDNDGVQARLVHAGKEESARFRWVVGTDGARGVVRKMLGLTFLGETKEQTTVVADVRIEGLSDDFAYSWSPKTKVGSMIRLRPSETPGVFQLVILWTKLESLPERENVDADYLVNNHDALARWVNQKIGREDVKVTEVIYAGPYTVNVRMANEFSVGRVFIAGDAAHIHSPTGAQGLNSGVQDAINLGWKLALSAKGLASPSLLSTYNAERHPVIAHMLGLTSELLEQTAKNMEQAAGRGDHMLMLGINYRRSVLAVEDGKKREEVEGDNPYHGGGGALRAGDRAPQAPELRVLSARAEDRAAGAATSVFELLRVDKHTAFVFLDAEADTSVDPATLLDGFPPGTVQSVAVLSREANAPAGIERFDAAVTDEGGHAFAAYAGARLVIVRPDGYVGAMVSGRQGVVAYTEKVFAL